MSRGVDAFTSFNSALMKGSNHCAAHALMTRLSGLLHLNVFLSLLNHSYLLLHGKSKCRCSSTVAVSGTDKEFLEGSWTSALCNLSEKKCDVHLIFNTKPSANKAVKYLQTVSYVFFSLLLTSRIFTHIDIKLYHKGMCSDVENKAFAGLCAIL